jgi:hypothetical protein
MLPPSWFWSAEFRVESVGLLRTSLYSFGSFSRGAVIFTVVGVKKETLGGKLSVLGILFLLTRLLLHGANRDNQELVMQDKY